MTATPICFIDTETNGLHPDRRPWEIAVIRRDEHGERELLIQVSDFDLSDADPMALRIGGFYDRHASYRPDATLLDGDKPFVAGDDTLWVDEATAASLVEEWTRGAIVVGANPGFDTETLDPLLRRQRLLPAWHYRPVCIEAVAFGFLTARIRHAESMEMLHSGGELELLQREIAALRAGLTLPWKSDNLGRLLGVEAATPEERHTALGDARWVMRMWDRINGGTR